MQQWVEVAPPAQGGRWARHSDDILALPQKLLEYIVGRFATGRLSERGMTSVQAVLSSFMITVLTYVLLFCVCWYSDFPIMDPAYLVLIGFGLLRVKPLAGRNVLLLVTVQR